MDFGRRDCGGRAVSTMSKVKMTTPSITRLHDEGRTKLLPMRGYRDGRRRRFITLCSPRFFAVPTPVSVSRIGDCTRLPSGDGYGWPAKASF